jgi:hypothetical protein
MRHFKKNCQLQGLESIFQTVRTWKEHEQMARTTRLIRLGKNIFERLAFAWELGS